MSDETAIRAAFAAGTENVVTPEAMATFKAQLEARGIDPSATLAKFSAQQPGGSKPSDLPNASPPTIDTSNPRFSDDQLQQAAENLARWWTGDPQLLKDALARSGITLPEANPGPDPRSSIAQEFDGSALAPPTDQSQYELGDLFVNVEGFELADLPAMAGNIRGVLGELGVSRALGRTVASDLLQSMRAANALQGKGEAAQQQYIVDQRALLARVLKVPYADVIATIKPFIDRLSPASRDFLAKGAVNSAPVLIRLYQTAQLRNARTAMGK